MPNEYPRVTSLTYTISSGAGYQYGEKAALDGALPGFFYKLRQREAVFTPTERFATEADARAKLEPLLRAWELSAALNYERGVIEFHFLVSQIQRAAPRPDVIELSAAAYILSGSAAILTLTFTESHPPPPDAFVTNEFVLTLVDLRLIAQESPRVLLYMAYSATTCVKARFGSFDEATKRLGVAANVFNAINKLAHTRGIGAERRKGTLGSTTPLSQPEREWLMQMFREIARRAGVHAAGAAFDSEVTLATHPLPKPLDTARRGARPA